MQFKLHLPHGVQLTGDMRDFSLLSVSFHLDRKIDVVVVVVAVVFFQFYSCRSILTNKFRFMADAFVQACLRIKKQLVHS